MAPCVAACFDSREADCKEAKENSRKYQLKKDPAMPGIETEDFLDELAGPNLWDNGWA